MQKEKRPRVEVVYDFQHPVKVNLVIATQWRRIKDFPKESHAPSTGPPTLNLPSAVSSKGMDLTGFEPAPATFR